MAGPWVLPEVSTIIPWRHWVFRGQGWWLSSWERAAQGPLLCPFCANTGQDLLPGRHSGSPVPCRWVQEFLNEENRGLDVLLEYLASVQCSVT